MTISHPSEQTPCPESYHIVLADDSVIQARLVAKRLERDGYRVILAHNGLEALEKVYEVRPHAVILDVEMPFLNGFQACHVLKSFAATRRLPVIILSSRDKPFDLNWGHSVGADAYVIKEEPIDRLTAKLGELIAKSGSRESPLGTELPARVDPRELILKFNAHLERRLYEATILGEILKAANAIDNFESVVQQAIDLLRRIVNLDVISFYFAQKEHFLIVSLGRDPIEQHVLNYQEVFNNELDRRVALSHARNVRTEALSLGIHDRSDVLPETMPFRLYVFGTTDHFGGAVGLWSQRPLLTDAGNEEVVSDAINTTHLVIQNAWFYREMTQLAVTDPVTGIGNHRYCQTKLAEEFDRAMRVREALSVIMLDIDHFKNFNDTYGHSVGDRVLAFVGSVLNNETRAYDAVARYGGEEFCVILPYADLNIALDVAERLRRAVAATSPALNIEHITISAGVSQLDFDRDRTPQDVLAHADAALYQAKANGRNRVAAWTGSVGGR